LAGAACGEGFYLGNVTQPFAEDVVFEGDARLVDEDVLPAVVLLSTPSAKYERKKLTVADKN
jgi:hypothetical protein